MTVKKLKWAAILSFIVAMVVLVGGRFSMQDELPPYPGKVLGPKGDVLFKKSDILEGQAVYQRYGLMDHGAVWGHGSQRGPEFSATTLHIVADAVRNYIAEKEQGKSYEQLDDLQKEIIDVKVRREVKTNRYDPEKDTLTLTPAQVQGLDRTRQHWEKTFKEGERLYGFIAHTVQTEEERLQISRFFFWTAWVASAKRPGKDYSYTNNWPADRSVGNIATTETYFWSIGGVLALLVVLGLFIYLVHRHGLWYGRSIVRKTPGDAPHTQPV
jgi:nitric oxide reductase subunit B